MPLPSALGSLLAATPSMPRTSPSLGGGPTPPGGPTAVPPGGGAPGGADSGPMSSAISKTLADTSGADPEYIKSTLRGLKSTLVALIPHTAFRFAGVDKHINVMYRAVESAIQEADKAASQIAAQSPINFSAASVGPQMNAPAATGM